MEMIKRFFKDEEGATAVEYGILVALIGAAIITTVGLLGDKLNDLFASVTAVRFNRLRSSIVNLLSNYCQHRHEFEAASSNRSHTAICQLRRKLVDHLIYRYRPG